MSIANVSFVTNIVFGVAHANPISQYLCGDFTHEQLDAAAADFLQHHGKFRRLDGHFCSVFAT